MPLHLVAELAGLHRSTLAERGSAEGWCSRRGYLPAEATAESLTAAEATLAPMGAEGTADERGLAARLRAVVAREVIRMEAAGGDARAFAQLVRATSELRRLEAAAPQEDPRRAPPRSCAASCPRRRSLSGGPWRRQPI